MKKQTKSFLGIIITSVILSLIYSIFKSELDFSVSFINTLFYISIPVFIIGGFMLILESGFFNVTAYAFKRLFAAEKKTESTAKKADLYRNRNYEYSTPIFAAGSLMFFLCIIVSYLFYM